jgi:hypothetical protein
MKIINYKHRIWALILLIPMAFIFFSITVLTYFLIAPTSEMNMYLLGTLFIIEIEIIIVLISKLRFISNGELIFDENGISNKNGKAPFSYQWGEISKIRYIYRGDLHWKRKLGNKEINTSLFRYHRLRNSFLKDLVHNSLDCIEVNGNPIYVKIRNQQEKEQFHNLINLSKALKDASN